MHTAVFPSRKHRNSLHIDKIGVDWIIVKSIKNVETDEESNLSFKKAYSRIGTVNLFKEYCSLQIPYKFLELNNPSVAL